MARKINLMIALEERIRSGVYRHRLPPMRQLADEYGVNLKTVNKAVRGLADEGLLEIRPGQGTFLRGRNGVDRTVLNKPMTALMVRHFGDMFENMYQTMVQEIDNGGGVPMLVPHRNDGGTRERLEELMVLRPESLIIDSSIYNVDYDYLRQLANHVSKIVFLISRHDNLDYSHASYILSDYFLGANMMVRRLVEMGHRNILMIFPEIEIPALRYRFSRHHDFEDGYIQTMREYGLREQVLRIPKNVGEAWMPQALEIMKQPGHPTAIISFLDEILAKLSGELLKTGMKIPDNVSMIGYHNTLQAENAPVPLDSVSICEDAIARLAAQQALSNRTGFSQTVVPPEMITRGSCIKI